MEARLPIEHSQAHWRLRLREYRNRCAYCGIHRSKTQEGYLEREHVQPVRRGGTDAIENVVPACHHCNMTKGNHRPGERVWTLDYRSRVIIPDPKPRKRHTRWC